MWDPWLDFIFTVNLPTLYTPTGFPIYSSKSFHYSTKAPLFYWTPFDFAENEIKELTSIFVVLTLLFSTKTHSLKSYTKIIGARTNLLFGRSANSCLSTSFLHILHR